MYHIYLKLIQQGPTPSSCSHHVEEQGRTIPLHYNRHSADLMERTLKPCRIKSLTWWILEERDDEEKECWREGGGIGGRGVRSTVYVTLESKWWYLIALEQTVIQTTLINFSTCLPPHTRVLHREGCNTIQSTRQQLWTPFKKSIF